MAWTTTTLWPGPLANDNYNYPIIGLAASTNYQYRAYFIIDGVPYYGNVLEGTTAAVALVPPEVTTGFAGPPTETSFIVSGNVVDDKGGAPIIEYGILWTQLGFWGTASNLVCSNYPTYVSKASTLADIATGVTYSKTASGLAASTTTYYRAYAKTAAGLGYGNVKTRITAAPPAPLLNMDIWLDWCGSSGFNDGFCGNFQLKCCNGATICSDCIYSVCDGTHYTCFAPVPAGCYYFDFYGINSVCGGFGQPAEIYLDDDTGSGWRKVTGCFSTSNLVCGCVFGPF